MDDYMHMNLDKSDEWIRNERDTFEKALSNVKRIFGRIAFRRWDNKNNIWRNQIITGLFESQMIVCHNFNDEEVEILEPKRRRIQRAMKTFTRADGEEYDQFFRAGTNQAGYFEGRIKAISNILNQFLEE